MLVRARDRLWFQPLEFGMSLADIYAGIELPSG